MENIYDEVITIICKTLKTDKNVIDENTNLFEDLEIDSLIILEIVNQIEKWGIKLTDYPQLLDEMETVNSLVEFLKNIEKGE